MIIVNKYIQIVSFFVLSAMFYEKNQKKKLLNVLLLDITATAEKSWIMTSLRFLQLSVTDRDGEQSGPSYLTLTPAYGIS